MASKTPRKCPTRSPSCDLWPEPDPYYTCGHCGLIHGGIGLGRLPDSTERGDGAEHGDIVLSYWDILPTAVEPQLQRLRWTSTI
eukprot:1937290-Pyramimonas_sp.AAC.2